jgi:hypothetical protein
MYYYVITIACSIIAMYYFCLVEEVFPFPWGIIPILKGLAFERLHMEGSIIFIDNRKKEIKRRLFSSPTKCEFRVYRKHEDFYLK